MARAPFGFGDYFFEIPVYRVDEEEHSKRMAELKRKDLEQFGGNAELDRRAEAFFEEKHREPWVYNEVVGWIALCGRHSQIRKHLYLPESKGIRRRTQAKIVRRTELLEVEFPPASTASRTIFDALLSSLERDQRTEPLLRRRYVDLTSLRAVGPLIDWRTLLGLSPL